MYGGSGCSDRTRRRRPRSAGKWFASAIALLASTAVVAQPHDYLVPEPLPKIAVLVGASSYSYLPELKNVPRDIDVLYDALVELGFADILVASNPCYEDFDAILKALEDRTRELAPDGGATVWIFLAGHGAMDPSHNQYLMPVNFDRKQLAGSDYYEVANRTEIFEEKLKKLFAGAGLVVVDACRTPFGDDDEDAEAEAVEAADVGVCKSRGTLVWKKHSSLPPVKQIGYAKKVQFARVGSAYSTRPGTEAPEAGDATHPGTYANALVAALRGATPQIPDIFTEAFERVTTSPNKAFYPIEPDFRPKALRAAWLGTLPDSKAKENAVLWSGVLAAGEQNPDTVRRFVEANSTSEYLRPALRWLKDRDLLAIAAQVTVVDSGAGETVQMRITESRSIPIRRHPVDGVRQASVQRPLQNELVIVEQSGWGRLASAGAGQPRYVQLDSIVNDAADLPDFWSHPDVVDATGCVKDGAASETCIAQLLQADRLPAGASVNVLAVEAIPGRSEDSPSGVAFRQAFAAQQALNAIGIGYSRSRIKVMPGSFAPAAVGRVLLRTSKLKEK